MRTKTARTKVSHASPNPKAGGENAANGQGRDLVADRLGGAKQAADEILAAWALQELAALRRAPLHHA